ncbi:hypothetical protein Btru_068132 [Bulinus truncatus]|nr:hypothetical protein Btru_068132 [Bulinus truncatus]
MLLVLLNEWGPDQIVQDNMGLPYSARSKCQQAVSEHVLVLPKRRTLVADQAPADVEDFNSDLGKLMTMVGFLIPSHYLLMSLFMGPLMDLTGNIWAPLMYSLACSAMGLLIFFTLFFVPVPKK